MVIIKRPEVVPTSDSQESEEHFHRGTLRVGRARSSLRGPTHGSKFPPNADESGILILFPNFASGAQIENWVRGVCMDCAHRRKRTLNGRNALVAIVRTMCFAT